MLNRNRFLFLFGVDRKRWATRYDLEEFSHPCLMCGAELSTTIPFVYGTLRGLIAPQCVCGHTGTPYCVVRDPAYGDLLTGESIADPIRKDYQQNPALVYQITQCSRSLDK
jgi:hypothetical protein